MEDVSSSELSLGMYGISLAVFPLESGCILELSADMTRQALLHRILSLCPQEASPPVMQVMVDDKMLRCSFQLTYKHISAEVFTHPSFYQQLNDRLGAVNEVKPKVFHLSRLMIESSTQGELFDAGLSIGELTISFNYSIEPTFIQRCANALKTCYSLRRLIIMVETFNRVDFQPILDALLFSPGVESLYFILKPNRGMVEMPGLKNILEKHPSLLSLDVSQCQLSPGSVSVIAEALCANTVLKTLNLSGNYLGGDATRALKMLVQKNKSLTHLDLSDGRMVCSELSRILSAITLDSSLLELNLSKNPLSELGVHYLLRRLVKNHPLKILNVSQCSMTTTGMSVFLTGLHAAPTLTTLNLSGYDFGQHTLDFLVALIQHNKVLRDLNVSRCGIYLGSLFKILDSLQRNPVLRKIDLSHNLLTDNGGKLILDFLGGNKTLECLVLNETSIRDAGLIALAEMLRINTSLKQLYLRGNNFATASVSVLLSALEQNRSLFSLDLGESVQVKEALGYLMGFMAETTRIRALGFMPKQAQRTVDLLALYEAAFSVNKYITDAHQDFMCRCGRCLCVKTRVIVKYIEDNKLNRYKNITLLIKAYLNPEENGKNIMAFKIIQKDVLLYIFKLAYPELTPKIMSAVSHRLFFKPRNSSHSPQENRMRYGLVKP